MAVFVNSPIPSVFVHVPKTGGTSIQRWLIENTDSFVVKGIKHANLNTIATRVPAFNWSFCVVRNPWDWVVSWYFFKHDRALRRIEIIKENNPPLNKAKKKHNFEYNLKVLEKHKKGFEYFVENIGNNTQLHKTSGVDYVMKLETLDKDFKIVQERLNCFIPLPYLNNSIRNKDYRSYYNTHTKDIVYNKFKDDIKHFNYEF